jgi:hypothetical protein
MVAADFMQGAFDRPRKGMAGAGKTINFTMPHDKAFRPHPTPHLPKGKSRPGLDPHARFLTTASRLDQLPASELPEVAFVGRSNAGKSTAINTLAQQKRLAFASRTPGRTQHINLFEVGPKDAPDALVCRPAGLRLRRGGARPSCAGRR